MLDRFQGPEGFRHLSEALRKQLTLQCSDDIISKIISVARPENFPSGSYLAIQGSDDNRLAFILSGRVEILIGGVKVAERSAGSHVGEMSVIDATARRSASVVAVEETCVAWVSEAEFTPIANAHPELWRALAIELADRIRQRGALVRAKNPKSIIFIGSSSESLPIAANLAELLRSDLIEVRLWKEGVFGASESTIESIESASRNADFAALVLSADDRINIRRHKQLAPRDNVIFELGLFMGAIGRRRTFMVVESSMTLRLPPDLAGITHLPFSVANTKIAYFSLFRRSQKIDAATLDLAAREILERIAADGPR